VASLLYQAKAQLSDEVRQDLFNYYYTQLNKVITIDYKTLLSRYKGFALLRTLQVLGAYGFRGYFEKKPHFIESIPFALTNLKNLLNARDIAVGMPHLMQVVLKMDNALPLPSKTNGLTIMVTSFSYRKGIPADTSGNGGGFVFDCRGIHNPGRYVEYQSFTGKDKPVIDFFKTETTIDSFLQNVINVVSPSVNEYMQRGFNHLMVNFGCTGGQHRSVYCAENFIQWLLNNYNLNAVIWHREQNERRVYDKKM
jgi:RNase adaptor protein for sRNA GlmZ degradation